jgi:hypothetical protein
MSSTQPVICVASTLAPYADVTAQRHAQTTAATDEKPPGMFTGSDGAFDISNFLSTRTGFLPLAVPITEPAVGYGLGIGLTFFHEKPPVVEGPGGQTRTILPSATVLVGATTLGDSNFYVGPYQRFLSTDSNFAFTTLDSGIPDADLDSNTSGVGPPATPGCATHRRTVRPAHGPGRRLRRRRLGHLHRRRNRLAAAVDGTRDRTKVQLPLARPDLGFGEDAKHRGRGTPGRVHVARRLS